MDDETATQTLHRLTSYAPGQDWDQPLDDPRLVHDFVGTDIDLFPWFFKRYEQALPVIALPARPAVDDGAGRRGARGNRRRRAD